MRYVFLILALMTCFVSIAQLPTDTGKMFRSNDFGWRYQRLKAVRAMILPDDTVFNKFGVAQVGGNIYTGNGSRWTAVGGSGGSGGWGITGNSGTNEATNFIGTTDNQSLLFKVNNKFFGRLAKTGGHISFGDSALSRSQTGINCIALGETALRDNTSGNGNIGIGYQSLLLNTNRKGHVAIGWQAGQLNVLGEHHTYVGTHAGQNVNIGNENVAIGSYALQYSVNSGNKVGQNTIVGTAAAFQASDKVTAIGYYSRFGTTPGNFNGKQSTSVGYRSLVGIENDSSVTALGDFTSAANNLTNATAIGSRARVEASNAMVLGSIAGVNGATTSTNVGIGTTSPAYSLHVNGTVAASTLPFVTLGADTVLTRNSTTGQLERRLIIASGGSSQWTTNGTAIHYGSGNVGINQANPISRLHVGGTGRFGDSILLNRPSYPTFPVGIMNTDAANTDIKVVTGRFISSHPGGSLMMQTVGGYTYMGPSGQLLIGAFAPVGSERLYVNGSTQVNGSLGIGASAPHVSAQLDVQSTSRGFLPPRMTTAQRLAIASPAEGLIVYDTDIKKSYTYDGTTWQAHW